MLRETYFAVTSRRCRRLLPPRLLLVLGGLLLAACLCALALGGVEAGDVEAAAMEVGGVEAGGAAGSHVPLAAAPAGMPEAAAEASGLRGAPELPAATRPPPTAQLHPAYHRLIREYPFQPCRTERGQLVNVIFVRSPFRSAAQEEMYERYKDEILFVGISSFEDFPLPPPNPYSGKFPKDKYVGMFPGFLHMMREPEKFFPPHVKLLLMSQSDFALPYPGRRAEKKYDFIYSGSDQDVHNDCEGWSSFAKNWTFAKQALEVMCGEYGLTAGGAQWHLAGRGQGPRRARLCFARAGQSGQGKGDEGGSRAAAAGGAAAAPEGVELQEAAAPALRPGALPQRQRVHLRARRGRLEPWQQEEV